MDDYTINIEAPEQCKEGSEGRSAVIDILHKHSDKFGHVWAAQPLAILVRDKAGKIIGGLIGVTNWGWLHIQLLAVDESARGKQLGTQLLAKAESEAIARGCAGAFLDTFSFQAQPFYEKNGYEVFGKLEDFPPGSQRFFMRKKLI